jgi:type IV secretion system protein TrbJ
MGSLNTLAQRAQNLQQVQSQIPGITGNVQGLQLLNQQSNVLAGEMVDLHALMERQVTQQTQDRVAQAQSQAAAAQLMQARQAAAQQIYQSEKNNIDGSPEFGLLKESQ